MAQVDEKELLDLPESTGDLIDEGTLEGIDDCIALVEKMAAVAEAPVARCGFCGREDTGGRTKRVGEYEILESCMDCEQAILEAMKRFGEEPVLF